MQLSLKLIHKEREKVWLLRIVIREHDQVTIKHLIDSRSFKLYYKHDKKFQQKLLK